MNCDYSPIQHDLKRKRFFIVIDKQECYVEYTLHDNSLDILHTVVSKPFEGQGIASQLVRAANDYAEANSLKPLATCSYAVAWLQRHGKIKHDVDDGKSFSADLE